MITIVNGCYGAGKTFYCQHNYKEKEIIYIDSLINKELNDNQIKNYILHSIILNKDKNLVIDFYFKQSWYWLLELIKNFCFHNSIKLYEININDYVSIEESYQRFCNRSKKIYLLVNIKKYVKYNILKNYAI